MLKVSGTFFIGSLWSQIGMTGTTITSPAPAFLRVASPEDRALLISTGVFVQAAIECGRALLNKHGAVAHGVHFLKYNLGLLLKTL